MQEFRAHKTALRLDWSGRGSNHGGSAKRWRVKGQKRFGLKQMMLMDRKMASETERDLFSTPIFM